MAPPRVVRSAFSMFFEYDTPRIVHIRSKKVGVLNRLVQLTIIGYIVGYVIVWKKGYQEVDEVQSAVTTKLKGTVYTNDSAIPGIDGRIWDVADYVVPPLENNAFFVMTNVVVTPEQRQGACGESPNVTGALCNTSADCSAGEFLPGGNGVMTGNCTDSEISPGTNVCQIYAWCPLEMDEVPDPPALEKSANFTVFIKNNIEFPKFGVQRRNLPDDATNDFLNTCHYNPGSGHDKFCPILTLSTIVSRAGHNYQDVAKEGGVMQIIITWDCNLDLSIEDCLPEYGFRRLDRKDFKISRGFNFRYADHYKSENGTSLRTLYKAFGIRFIVSVQGQAGKFHIIPLLMNIASGLALLSVATIICDIFVLYLLKARSYYWDKKYLDVKGEDAYEVLDESLSRGDPDGQTRQRSAMKRESDDP
ncbi:P2X purinoceptor 4-like isoform X2 [Babylonia areolata]|uniref:P2X purinoceptor 4-like isoform X2 n=1 Tax=Babylonia areolata TaxID=304850 RepID=UPI003FCF36FF